MILREIKNMYIKNRLTEGVDFKRYEWLKGDSTNKAYIDTTIYDLDSIHTIDIIFKPVLPIESVFGRQRTASERFCIQYQISTKALVVYTINYYELKPVSTDGEIVHLIFDLDNSLVTDGTKTVTISGFKNQNTTLSLNLFNIRNSNQYYNGRIKSFIIDNKINLVPCQLLKSIPATLDANNISRSAGECGMYDSISGKFFGNVANSGTFTVEGDVEPETHSGLQQIYQNKLIEGVDYETYDWLKADIPISTAMMNLPINSKNFEFKRNWIQLMNSGYFSTSSSNNKYGYYIVYFEDGAYPYTSQPQIWNSASGSNTYRSSIKVGLGIHTISANDNGVTISSVTNTASLPWYGTPEIIVFNNANNEDRHTIHLTSSIKVDGVTRYVPCQLLRSIPRNLDAQCKERVAGECGMIDLISGKFYGNVANSGTFTVENDNE